MIREDDSDFDTETELPRLEDTIPSEVLKRLKPKEKKRQDVINGRCDSVLNGILCRYADLGMICFKDYIML